MKIGEKEYTLKITNRVIIGIENKFEKSISEIMSEIAGFTTTDMCTLIHTALGENAEISLDDLIEAAAPNQLVPAATEVISEINKAFGFDTKKK